MKIRVASWSVRDPTIRRPQLGQTSAFFETGCPQSAHGTKFGLVGVGEEKTAITVNLGAQTSVRFIQELLLLDLKLGIGQQALFSEIIELHYFGVEICLF
jgi:hypothetical protein